MIRLLAFVLCFLITSTLASAQVSLPLGGSPGVVCAVPGTIADLAEVSNTDTTSTLSFSTPSGTPTGYQWSDDGVGWTTFTSPTVTGLTPATTYATFRIRAVNGCGDGAGSNQISITTDAASGCSSPPASVVAAGIETTWCLSVDPSAGGTAGIKNAPNKTPAGNTGSLPSGWAYNATGANGSPLLSITAGSNGSQWDMTGVVVQVGGTGTSTCTDCKFQWDTSGGGQSARILSIGRTWDNSTNGTPTFILVDSEVDGTGNARGGSESIIQCGHLSSGSSGLQITGSYLHDSLQDFITTTNCNLTVATTYFIGLCVNQSSGAHCEYVHDQGSVGNAFSFTNVFMQNTDTGTGALWTGFLRPENSGGTATWAVTDSIFAGTQLVGTTPGTTAFQFAGSNTNTYNNNLIDNGTSAGSAGYFVKGGNTLTCTVANHNYTTGAAITCP